MKRILKNIFLIIVLVIAVFWTIGWFSVPEAEHKLLLIAYAVSEIIPLALWRIMGVLIKRDERREERTIAKSVPIWERDKKETDLTTTDDTEKNVSGNTTDKTKDGGEKTVVDSNAFKKEYKIIHTTTNGVKTEIGKLNILSVKPSLKLRRLKRILLLYIKQENILIK